MRIPNGSKYITVVQSKNVSGSRFAEGPGWKGPLWGNVVNEQTVVHQHSADGRRQLFLYEHFEFLPPFAPDASCPAPAAAKYSCLWLAARATAHPSLSPYLGYRVVLPRVVLCTHYVFSAKEESESNSKRQTEIDWSLAPST